ncbi:MAG TPA: translesion error-prone DNA polymerase V autoproteolytic subunit [Agriterribacter sp.]|nr:translesion error-prone DNA polymerase V autoproteolytic subunit [Agriterribacter sp.]
MDNKVFYPPVDMGSNQLDRSGTTYPDTGFGAAIEDGTESGIDLNVQFIRNRPATFLMQVNGNAMTRAGIFNGDLVIVDRSVTAINGKIVIAILNGEMLIRRFEKKMNKVRLIPETNRLAPIDVDPSASDFSIWGVVTYCIHSL